jgi:zinc transport system permease protein
MPPIFEFLELPQMQRAFIIALIAGPVGAFLGSFITLKRMSFFSDAIAHGAITGVTIGVAFHLATDVTGPTMRLILIGFCIVLALVMAWLLESTTLHSDSVIAFSYTGSMALGAVVISRVRGYPMLESALFGDILSATSRDVWIIAGLGILVFGFLAGNMRGVTLTILDDSLARLEGVNTRRLNYMFVILTALVVAVLLPQLGALLISGLIVVPAAAARLVAGSFRAMLVCSATFGLAGAVTGVAGSYHFDSPTGPSIVLADVALFAACLVWSSLVGARHWRRR